MSPKEFADAITPALSDEEIHDIMSEAKRLVYGRKPLLSSVDILSEKLEEFGSRLAQVEKQLEELKWQRSH